jgi:hypothetical protein
VFVFTGFIILGDFSCYLTYFIKSLSSWSKSIIFLVLGFAPLKERGSCLSKGLSVSETKRFVLPSLVAFLLFFLLSYLGNISLSGL